MNEPSISTSPIGLDEFITAMHQSMHELQEDLLVGVSDSRGAFILAALGRFKERTAGAWVRWNASHGSDEEGWREGFSPPRYRSPPTDADADVEQPMDLEGWRQRQFIETEAKRAQAHRDVDAVFAKVAAQQAADFERIRAGELEH